MGIAVCGCSGAYHDAENVSVQSDTSAEGVVKDALRVEPETVDLGDVWQCEVSHVSFCLENCDDQPLRLSAAVSCGCVANIKIVPEQLERGQTGELTATLQKTDPGKFSSRISVKQQGVEESLVVLSVVGYSRKAYDVSANSMTR